MGSYPSYPLVLFLIWFKTQDRKRGCYLLGSSNSNKVNTIISNIGDNFSKTTWWDSCPLFHFHFHVTVISFTPRDKSKSVLNEVLKHAMGKTDHGLWQVFQEAGLTLSHPSLLEKWGDRKQQIGSAKYLSLSLSQSQPQSRCGGNIPQRIYPETGRSKIRTIIPT